MVYSLIGNAIGACLGSEKNSKEDCCISPCFKPGFLVDFGIFWVQSARKVIMSGVYPSYSPMPINHKCDQICRAQLIPRFMPPEDCKDKEIDVCPKSSEGWYAALKRRMLEAHEKCRERPCDTTPKCRCTCKDKKN